FTSVRCCHCEEQRDEAISMVRVKMGARLLRGVYPRAAPCADPWARNDSSLQGYHLFRNSRSFRKTVFWSGLSGRSGKASRRRRITVGLVSRKKVLISLSRLSVVREINT